MNYGESLKKSIDKLNDKRNKVIAMRRVNRMLDKAKKDKTSWM